MDKKKTYVEARQIRADNTIMLGLRMVERSGLISEENVDVKTEIGSGKIMIERMEKRGEE